MKASLTIVTAMTLAACMPTLHDQPVQFAAPVSGTDPVTSVAQALAAAGATPVVVDSRVGLIQTRWEDTGFGFGYVQREPATIVRRYVAALQQTPQGTIVTIRGEAQKCAHGGFSVGDTDVRGPCERLSGLIDQHQADLEVLGQRVQESLGGARVSIVR